MIVGMSLIDEPNYVGYLNYIPEYFSFDRAAPAHPPKEKYSVK
jgi:hypothetical protein